MSGWTKKQIIQLQCYRRYANLSEQEYRALLFRVTGERSSTAPSLTQGDYDQVMAEIEEELCQRIDAGEVDVPRARISLDYWRKRCPLGGLANTRQLRLLRALAELTRETLPPEKRPADLEVWLLGVARLAGTPVQSLDKLTEMEAMRLIEAAKDRLRALGIDTRAEGLTQGRTRRKVKKQKETERS